MEKLNHYNTSYSETTNHIDYIKYGLLNEFGDNINREIKSGYNEEAIIKKRCNIRNMKSK